MAPSSDPPTRTSTPRSFQSQTASAEDLLKSQTVGLVHLSDFRKRRAEVLEQKEREAQDKSLGRFKSGRSGTATPTTGEEGSDGALTPRNELQPPQKKKKKQVAKGKLSFNHSDDEDTVGEPASATGTPHDSVSAAASPAPPSPSRDTANPPRRLTPNPHASIPAPKALTKASLHAEALARDSLRREFLALQENIKATEILIPFVFYDGTNIPGGKVKVKKGDHIWVFLERCRKVGAELGVSGGGVGGSKNKNDSRKEWARVGVDDLMCVRGEVIIPHHYEFYYFIANRVANPSSSGGLLFDYANSAPADSNALLRTPSEDLEGSDMDPTWTKVVDRRWYERNKHIFPASLWREYEPGKDFEEKMASVRRDGEGNAFFFS